MNACVRFIFDLRKDEHITPWYNQLNWLSTDKRMTFLTACFIRTILDTSSPPYLSCHLTIAPQRRGRTCSTETDLAISHSRTTTFQKSFRIAAPTLWNSLPPHISVNPTHYHLSRHPCTIISAIQNSTYLLGCAYTHAGIHNS